MKIPVVIFSYGKETEAAAVAARRALAAGLGPVYIASDAKNPCGPIGGTRVILTTFERPRSLRGFDCFQGMLKTYRQILNETGASHILKLDSDTVIVRADRLFTAAVNDASSLAGSQKDYPFLGWCCLLSRRFIESLYLETCTLGGCTGFSNCCMPEDRVLGARTDHDHSEQPYNPAGSFTAAYQYDRATIPLEEYAARFDVITFGNRRLIKGDRKVMVATMERLVQIIETT